MRALIIITLSLGLALVGCRTPNKKTEEGSAANAGTARAAGPGGGEVLIAARSASEEAEAAIRETERALAGNDLGEENSSASMSSAGNRAGNETGNGREDNSGDAGSAGGANSGNGSENGAESAEASRGDNGENESTGNRRGERSAPSNSTSATGDGRGANTGESGSDLGDMARGATGTSRESSGNSGREAEFIEEENSGSHNASADRGRASMETPEGERRDESGRDGERTTRNRRDIRESNSQGPGENESFESEVRRAERQAIAAAKAAEEAEKEAEAGASRAGNNATTGTRSNNLNRSERRTAENSEAERDGESDSASANEKGENRRRTIVSGQPEGAERTKETERETEKEIDANVGKARESERATRRHRRTIVTDGKETERSRRTEREDTAELRLNREGTYTDTRGSAMGSETVAREQAAKSGLIAADTYQVFVTVFGDSKDEAMRQGKIDARLKAYNLLLKEHRGGRRLSERGRRDLRQFINRNGRVTDVSKQSQNSWNITLQIKNPRLRSFLKKLR